MRFQIVFTYRCNLACEHCDRYMDVLPWEDSDITMEDLRLGATMVRKAGVEPGRSKIGGGEALVHPDFVELTKMVRREWTRPGGKTSVATNGILPRPRRLGVRYILSVPKQKQHFPVMISPADLGLEIVQGVGVPCSAQRFCGRLFDAFGFSFCPYAGTMGRVLGIDPYGTSPVLPGREEVCRHCIHGLPGKIKRGIWKDAVKGRIEHPTKTFREGLDRGLIPIKKFQERLGATEARTGAYTSMRQRRTERVRTVKQYTIDTITASVPKEKTIIDLGAGLGHHVRALRELGCDARGVDGTRNVEEQSEGLIKHVDLTRDCSRLYNTVDWGLFLEVGEHVPQELEGKLLDEVCRIPREGLIVSWAGIGQAGLGHVNCRTPAYVAGEFTRRGWRVDDESTHRARELSPRSVRHRIMVLRRKTK